MRRTLPVIAVLAGMLACSASAFAGAIAPGHNPATRALEAAYKFALLQRKDSADGCYQSPNRVAATIRKNTNLKVGVARSSSSIHRLGVVFVVRKGASCERLRMAIRAQEGLYVLDSAVGVIKLQGKKPERGSKPRGPVNLISKSFNVTQPDKTTRLVTLCPRGSVPLGGGMISSPGLDPDGGGVYPHSYERLGAQEGWHISVVFLDPSPANATPRKVTVQSVCGSRGEPSSSPHRTVFIKPGETKTATAKCPGGQVLFSGGFQRTDFRSPGGDYITESRAVGPKAWRVTGSAFGTGSGELTALAYCVRSKRPLLTEVSASTSVAMSQEATATTPLCPAGQKLTLGGFSANGSQHTLFAAGAINQDGTWSATSYGFFGPAPTLTAYGYCLRI
jgi:hypothetical protein